MEKPLSLVEIELARTDWRKPRDIRSSFGEKIVGAEYVPSVIRALLNAESLSEAEDLERKIENNVYVQRRLFESAEYLVPVLIASLSEVSQGVIRNTFLSMLFEIVAGYPDQSEIALDNYELAERCRAKAREGLWVLYRLLVDGDEVQRLCVYDILEKIETDSSRLEAFVKQLNLEFEI
jgi:hypothetical protein